MNIIFSPLFEALFLGERECYEITIRARMRIS